jgi:hypothetical protein
MLAGAGGIMLEMIPARVTAPAGQSVAFACSFHSDERLSLEFSEDPPSMEGGSEEGGPPYEHLLKPYKNGYKRLKSVAIRPELRSITCTARNKEGHEVGSISSMVYPTGACTAPPRLPPSPQVVFASCC